MAGEEINLGALTEADTCRLFVTPALHAAGWGQAPTLIDLKNPHAKTDLEHADPKDLVASMRAREQDVMRLLAEIEALVSEA